MCDASPKSARRHRLLLALLITLHLASSAAAILADQYPMIPDAADYFDWSARVARHLRAGDPLEAISALFENPQRPPLGIIPTALLLAVTGPSPAAARLSMLAWFSLLVLLTYRLGLRLRSPEAGLLAAGAIAAAPAIMGFSRLLWMDLPLAAMTCWAMLALLRTERFTRPGASVAFGAICGLALLTKHALPVFLAGPALGTLVLGLRRAGRGQRLRVLGHAGLAGVAAAALFALWAVPHLSYVVKAVQMARPDVAATSGARFRWITSSDRFTFYLERLPTSLAGPLVTALFLAGLVLLVRAGRASRGGAGARQALALTSLWLWGSLLLLNLFVPWERYALPLVPAVALTAGIGLCLAGPLWERRAWAVPALLALLTAYAAQQTWFGPQLTWCGAGPSPHGRIFCAGMVRPVLERPPRPPALRFTQEPIVLAAVIPTQHIMLDTGHPAAPPLDRIGEALRQWLLVDSDRTVEVEPLTNFKPLTARILHGFRLVAVVEPGRGAAIPPEQQEHARQTVRLIRADPGRWQVVRRFTFPDGARLVLYRNPKLFPLPRQADW